MDLIAIAEILWRRKILTIAVLAVTALGCLYVVKIKAPVYQAQSSLLMVPPTPPTSAQLAANPSLAKINPNNPYVNYGDYSIVADALIDDVTDGASQQLLLSQGADPRYTLALSTDYGNPPIIDITGVGKTPEIAERSADLVTKRAEAELQALQASQGVNTLYMIKGTQLVTPTSATQSVSGKLRTLIAVLAAGVLALFVGISLAEAVEKRRRAKARRDPVMARSHQADSPRTAFPSRYHSRPGWESSGPDAGHTGPRGAERGGPAPEGGAPGAGPGPDRRAARQPAAAPSARPGPLDRPPGRPLAPTGGPGAPGL